MFSSSRSLPGRSRKRRKIVRTAFLVGLLAMAPLLAPQSALAQTCVEPPSGIVSWWPAEDDAEDILGDNDGTLQDTTTFAAAVVGSGFLFDGANDHVLVPDAPSLDPQVMTLEAWIQTSEVDNHFIVSKSGSTGTFGYELDVGMINGGRARFTLNGGLDGATDVHGTTILADGQFHHLVATFDGARSKLYVGARELSGIPGFFPGIVDELTLYSRALCAAEVAAIYDAGATGKCSGGLVVDCPILTDNFEFGDLGEWSTNVQ
jgi:hypothetical protein